MSAAQHIEVPGLGEPHANGAAVYLLVDAPLRASHDSREAGRDLPAGTSYRVVHAISRWRGGEVRGYLLVDGTLTVRAPHYTDWPALDAAVKAALDAAGVR